MFNRLILSVVTCIGAVVAQAEAPYTLPFRLSASGPLGAEAKAFDCNNDDATWWYNEETSSFRYFSTSNDADDWLMLPKIDFGNTTKAKVTLSLRADAMFSQKIELCYGWEADPTNMYKEVTKWEDYTTYGEIKKETCYITDLEPNICRTWVLGLHAYSNAKEFYIDFFDISVEDAECPENLKIKESSVDVSTCRATITMPGKLLDESDITDPLTLEVTHEGEVIATITGCRPGSDVEFVHYFRPNNVPYDLEFRAVTSKNKKSEPSQCSFQVDYMTLDMPIDFNAVLELFPQCSLPGSTRLNWSYTPEKDGAYMFAPTETENGLFFTPNVNFNKPGKVRIYADVMTDGPMDNFELVAASSPSLSSIEHIAAKEPGFNTRGKYVTIAGDVDISTDLSRYNMSCVGVNITTQNTFYIKSIRALNVDYIIPLAVDFTDEYDKECAIIDGNDDGNLWGYDSQAHRFTYKSSSTNAADDWLMLPLMDFGDAKRVKVSMNVAENAGAPARLELKLGQERTASRMTVEAKDMQVIKVGANESKVITATFELPEPMNGNTWAVGIHAVSDAGGGRLAVSNIIIEDIDKTSAPVAPTFKSDIADFVYHATVTMPAKDIATRDITRNMTLVVSVDGTSAETLTDCAPGAPVEVSYPLGTGSHQIAFKAVLDNQESEEAFDNVMLDNAKYSLPFAFSTTTEENISECTIIDVNNDKIEATPTQGAWYLYSAGDLGVLRYYANKKENDDDWIILPPVDFGGVKKVKVTLRLCTSTYGEDFEVYLGQKRTVEGMTLPIIKETGLTTKEKWQDITFEADIPEHAAGSTGSTIWSLGFHASTPKSVDQREIRIESIKIERLVVPCAPLIKRSRVNNFNYKATVTMPDKDLDGMEITAPLSLTVSIDGTPVETLTDCQPGADVKVSHTITEGDHVVSYTAALDSRESDATTDNVTGTQYTSYTLPYTFSQSQDTYGEAYEECVEIDVNNDGFESGTTILYKWKYTGGNQFCYRPKSGNAADDWVMLPMVNFGDAKRVKISVGASCEGSHPMEVMLGQGRTVGDMTVSVIKKTEVSTGTASTLQWLTAYVDVAASDNGNYWALGLHAVSDGTPNSFFLRVQDIKIEDATDAVIVPAAPTIKNSSLSDYIYTATVTMPDKDVEGLFPYTDEPMSLVISVDGNPVQTITGCTPGSDVDISVTLTGGNHVIGYKVVANNQESAEATDQASQWYTNYKLPLTYNCSAHNVQDCKVFDNNHDGKTWTHYGSEYYLYSTGAGNTADDWMMLPKVDFGNAKRIGISLKVDKDSSYDCLKAELGRERSVEAMTVNVPLELVTEGEEAWLKGIVDLPADAEPGKWVLGLHAIAEDEVNQLKVYEIQIVSLKAPLAPTLTSSSSDDLNYIATVTMPDKDMEGNNLTAPLQLAVIADYTEVQRIADCSPGTNVDVSVRLSPGHHNIGFRAVVDGMESSETPDEVTITNAGYSLPFVQDRAGDIFKECKRVTNIFSGWALSDDGASINLEASSEMGTTTNSNWLMFPMVNFGNAKTVLVKVKLRDKLLEGLELKLGRERTIEGMTHDVFTKPLNTGDEEKELTVIVDVPWSPFDNNLSLGLHTTSTRFSYCAVSAVSILKADKSVSIIKPAAPSLNSHSISDLTYKGVVTMPETDVNGYYFNRVMSLVVLVDDEEVETIPDLKPGTEVNVAYTLTNGNHKISYIAVLDMKESEALTKEVTVTHKDYTLPFEFAASEDTFNECAVMDVDGDKYQDTDAEGNTIVRGAWSHCELADVPAFGYRNNIHYEDGVRADDWIIFPFVDFGSCKKIKVSLDILTMDENAHDFEVLLGQERNITAMSTEIMNESKFATGNNWETITFEANLPQQMSRSAATNNKWAVGIHTGTNGYETDGLFIRNVKIENADPTTGIDDVVTDGCDTPVEYYNLQGVRIETPAPGTFVIERRGNKAVKKIFR